MRSWLPWLAMASSVAPLVAEELETVTVLGQKDQSVVVVDLDEPDGTLAYGLLQELPGVQVDSSGGPGTLTAVRVRGGEADHLLVIRDGVKLNDLANPDWGVPFKGSATRAYFLPGAQGAISGGEAASGVLRLETARPEQSGLVLTTSLAHRYRHGKVAGSWATERRYLSMDWERDDNLGRDSAQAADEDLDGYRYTDLRARAGTQFFGWNVEVALEDLNGRSDYDPGDSSTWHDRRIYRAKGTKAAPNGDWTWMSSKVATAQEHVNAWGERTTAGERRHHSLQWTPAQSVSVLIEKEREDYRQDASFLTGAVDSVDVYALSVQHQRSSRFADWAFALRKDWNSAFEDFATYRWGLKTRGAVKAFVGAGTGARRPTPLELAGWPGFRGNPTLVPEETLSIEAGVEGENWRVALFRERAANAIDGWACTEPTLGWLCPGQRTAVNLVGASHRKGVEIRLNAPRREGFKVAYTYVDSRNAGEWELRRPRNLLTASYRRKLASSLSAKVALNCASRFKDFGMVSVPGRCLTHFDMLWENSLGRVRVRADNALGKRYQPLYGYNGSSRWIVVRVEMPIL